MLTTTILATLLFHSPTCCQEYLNLRAESRPVMAMRSDIGGVTVIVIAGAKVALRCEGNEYRAVLLRY